MDRSNQTKKFAYKVKLDIKKPPVDMDYNELDTLLDSLLELESLPSNINYKSDSINYRRRSKLWIITKALYRLARAEIFYMSHIRKRLGTLKKSKEVYDSLKKTGCLKSLKQYLQLSKIGQTKLFSGIKK